MEQIHFYGKLYKKVFPFSNSKYHVWKSDQKTILQKENFNNCWEKFSENIFFWRKFSYKINFWVKVFSWFFSSIEEIGKTLTSHKILENRKKFFWKFSLNLKMENWKISKMQFRLWWIWKFNFVFWFDFLLDFW
jgi:hypothetical protein